MHVMTVSALKSKGLLVANEKGSWALERGCKLTGEFAGQWGLSILECGNGVQPVKCAWSAPDYYKKKDLVCAAIAYVDGDRKNCAHRRGWSDQSQFDRQLSALLLSGGLKP